MEKNQLLLRTYFKSCPVKIFGIARFLSVFLLTAGFIFSTEAFSQASYSDDAGGASISNSVSTPVDIPDDPQQMRVSGVVTNELGDPLAGATIQVEGTSTGAISDLDGKFAVDVPDRNAVLVISFIGYQTQKIAVAGRTTINVSMVPAESVLQEVVVTGYGTQKRTSITGSVSVVKGEEVAKVPVSNISNSMSGKMAGVLTRANGGQPGEDNADIHIRGVATTGSSAPLIVVDGVIRNNINQVDPSTIESVSILKDASAVAPYGMGGANGVILITTKKGAAGLPTLSLNTYYGYQTPTYYPRLLNAVDYMKLRNEAVLNDNPTAVVPFDPERIANYASLHAQDPDRYPDSNTKDLVNMWAPLQKHDIQLSGGSEKMRYFAGLGFFRQDGLFDKVNYNRYNLNLNLESKVTNTTTFTVNFLGTIERINDLDIASSANQLFRNGYKFIPTEAIYFSNGLWGQFAGNSPVAVLNGGYERRDINTLLSTFMVEQQLPFIKGLSVKGSFSYDTRLYYQKGWHTPFYYYAINLNTTPYTFTRQISTQEGAVPAYTYLQQQNERSNNYTFQGYLNYARTFGKSEVTGLVVAEARANDFNYLYARRNNFAIQIDEMSLGSSSKNDYDNAGSSSRGTQIGYVYRFGYVYNNRYMVEASGRYDGHYYFAPGKRWGYFPAFSVGWRISEESFMQNLSWIDNLKLRASWGKSGNLAGSAYQYLSGYTLAGNGYAFGTGTMVQEAYVTRENNPNITWEVSQKTNVGFESSLWKGLLTAEFDWFYERRSGMLLEPAVTVPYEYGLSLAQENAGEMDNFGFELTLGSRHDFQNGLSLSVNGNLSIAKNKMVEIFETAATYNNPNRRRTGRAYNTNFGYKTDGLFSTSDDKNSDGIINSLDGYNITQWGVLHPGDIRYVDVSGPDGTPDGKIDSNDEVEIGYPSNYPMMTMGLTGMASWKGFDLNLFFQGAGMTSFNILTFQTYPFYNNNSNCDYEYYENRWTPDNQDAIYPRATPNPVANNTQSADFWMRNTSYLRLKNASFGYTIPARIMQTLKMKSIRVYVASTNLFTISNLNFMDPEMGYTQRDVAYPNMKSFTFGANVTF